jgi:hypothetical protein
MGNIALWVENKRTPPKAFNLIYRINELLQKNEFPCCLNVADQHENVVTCVLKKVRRAGYHVEIWNVGSERRFIIDDKFTESAYEMHATVVHPNKVVHPKKVVHPNCERILTSVHPIAVVFTHTYMHEPIFPR